MGDIIHVRWKTFISFSSR